MGHWGKTEGLSVTRKVACTLPTSKFHGSALYLSRNVLPGARVKLNFIQLWVWEVRLILSSLSSLLKKAGKRLSREIVLLLRAYTDIATAIRRYVSYPYDLFHGLKN